LTALAKRKREKAMSKALKDEIEVFWPEQRQQRIEMGDKLDVPREVVFFSYFKKKAAVAGAEDELMKLGYLVSSELKTFGKSSLMAKTDSALTDAAVRKFLTEVITVIEAAGGEFDGFVAEVVE
jgi:hypothetical protein